MGLLFAYPLGRRQTIQDGDGELFITRRRLGHAGPRVGHTGGALFDPVDDGNPAGIVKLSLTRCEITQCKVFERSHDRSILRYRYVVIH